MLSCLKKEYIEQIYNLQIKNISDFDDNDDVVNVVGDAVSGGLSALFKSYGKKWFFFKSFLPQRKSRRFCDFFSD